MRKLYYISYLLLLSIIQSCTFENKRNLEDEQDLLDIVQQQTLNYFWKYHEPNSGLARERYFPDGVYPENDSHIVATGGSGFGLMSLIVGVERGFIPRDAFIKRLEKNLDFLETSDRFKGVWPHWLNGETGKAKPFSIKDDGGDLVETSYLAMGFICIREYLKDGTQREKKIAERFNLLWEQINWNFYSKGENALYWHWSPNYGWDMNFKLTGYNEALLTYVMACSSPTYPVDSDAYHQTWADGGSIITEKKSFSIPHLLQHNEANHQTGPLFWSHYSYLGLNPNSLKDKYANYWDVNLNHNKINYEYTFQNPLKKLTYSNLNWGLTASYSNNDGELTYSAHSPANDKGVISPTGAISSIVYLPEQSISSMQHFYVNYHDFLWGEAGFYDAFSLEDSIWVAKGYLAIDQGPQIIMIENYRTGVLWDLFMNAPEIEKGLLKMGFSKSYLAKK